MPHITRKLRKTIYAQESWKFSKRTKKLSKKVIYWRVLAKRPFEEREFKFSYLCSLLSETLFFRRKQNGCSLLYKYKNCNYNCCLGTSNRPKGQMISIANFEVFIWTNNWTKISLYFCSRSLKWVKSKKKKNTNYYIR